MNIYSISLKKVFGRLFYFALLITLFIPSLFASAYLLDTGNFTLPGTDYSGDYWGLYTGMGKINITNVTPDSIISVNNNGTGIWINSYSSAVFNPLNDVSAIYTFNIANSTTYGIAVEGESSLEFNNANINITNNITTNAAAIGINVEGESSLIFNGNGGNVILSSGNASGIAVDDSIAEFNDVNVNVSNNRGALGGQGYGLYAGNNAQVTFLGNKSNTLTANTNIYGLFADASQINITDMNLYLSKNRSDDGLSGAGLYALGGSTVTITGDGTLFNKLEVYNNNVGVYAGSGAMIDVYNMDIKASGNTAAAFEADNAGINITGRAGGFNTLVSTGNVSALHATNSGQINLRDITVTASYNSSGAIHAEGGSISIISDANNSLTANNNVYGVYASSGGAVSISSMNVTVSNNLLSDAGGSMGAGLLAQGEGSVITIEGYSDTGRLLTAENNLFGLLAAGGKIEISSMNISAVGNYVPGEESGGLYAVNGGTITVNGAALGRGELVASGNGAGITAKGASVVEINNMNINAVNNNGVGNWGLGSFDGSHFVVKGSLESEDGNILNVSGSNIGVSVGGQAYMYIQDMDVNINNNATGFNVVDGSTAAVKGKADGSGVLDVSLNNVGIAVSDAYFGADSMDIIASGNDYNTPQAGIKLNSGATVVFRGRSSGNNVLIATGTQTGVLVSDDNSAILIDGMNAVLNDNGHSGLHALDGGLIYFKGKNNGANILLSTGTTGAYASGQNSQIYIENSDAQFGYSNTAVGAGVYAESGGNVTVTALESLGKTFNSSHNALSGVYANGGSVNIQNMNVEVSNHVAGGNQGAGLYAINGGTVSVKGGALGNNTLISTANVYGIKADSASVINIEDINLNISSSSNAGGTAGAGIYASGSSVNIVSGLAGGNIAEFSNNAQFSIALANSAYMFVQNMNITSHDAVFAALSGYANTFEITASTLNLTAQANIAFDATGASDLLNTVNITNSNITADTLLSAAAKTANVNVLGSAVTGDFLGQNANLSLTNSVWNMPGNNSMAGNLTADASVINLALSSPDYRTLNVYGIYTAVNSPLIIMRAALEDGGSADNVNLLDAASGSTTLRVINNGGLGGLTTGDGIMLVEGNTLSDGAVFELDGGKVDIAAYEYYLYKGGETQGLNDYNWYLRTQSTGTGPGPGPGLQPEPVLTNTFKTIANMPAMTLMMVKTGMNSLNKRLGDLRNFNNNDNMYGAWGRAYAKDITVSDLIDTDLTFFGLEVGYDYLINQDEPDQFFVGLMAGYLYNSDTKTKQDNGRYAEGDGNAPNAGVYGSWISEKGYFADLVVRNFWSNMEMTNYAADGTEITYKPEREIIAVSLEFGKNFRFGRGTSSSFRLEPKAEVMYAYANSKTVTASSGFDLSYDKTSYINGRVAVLAGYTLTRQNGFLLEPVIEAAYNHEFDGKGGVKYGGASYETDLSGGSFEGSVGFNMHFTKDAYLYLQGTYEKGRVVEGFGGNIGVRFGFGGGDFIYMNPVK